MKSVFFAALFLFSVGAYGAEVAPAGSRSTRPAALSQEQCEKSYDEMGCAALENDEDTKDYIRKCSESLTETNYPAAAKACLSSGLGAWGEVLKALKDSPQAIAYGIADDLYKKNKPVLALNNF